MFELNGGACEYGSMADKAALRLWPDSPLTFLSSKICPQSSHPFPAGLAGPASSNKALVLGSLGQPQDSYQEILIPSSGKLVSQDMASSCHLRSGLGDKSRGTRHVCFGSRKPAALEPSRT